MFIHLQGALNYSAYFIGAYFVPTKSSTLNGANAWDWDSKYDVGLAYLLTLSFFLLMAFILIFKK